MEFESWQSETYDENLPNILEDTHRNIIHHDKNNHSNEANVNSFLQNFMDSSDDGSYAHIETCDVKTKVIYLINLSGNDDAKEDSEIGSDGSGSINSLNLVSQEDLIDGRMSDRKSVDSIKHMPSFSYASRKGKPRLIAELFIFCSSTLTVFFAFQLPISISAKILIAIGAINCSLGPIFSLKDSDDYTLYKFKESPLHYLVAYIAFLACSLSVYLATYDLWSTNWILQGVMLTMGICIVTCVILTYKWMVFEWLLMWILSSWYPIMYLICSYT